ncbi:MAG TPA: 2-oxoglutarate and iron-dependent oxygenase domain-containing protein, partial [Kofleriaceae bacterium]
MTSQNIPVVDLGDWHEGGAARQRFVTTVGESLADIGFFAVRAHGVPDDLMAKSYDLARTFFHLPADTKARYHDPAKKGQRGFTGMGKEHARDAQAADLKEFWQLGRPGWRHPQYGDNLAVAEIPQFAATFTELYERLDALGQVLLQACAAYIEEPAHRFANMAKDSDTIVRVLFYPPVGNAVPP